MNSYIKRLLEKDIIVNNKSFPALYQNETISTEKFYNSYLRTYLERDIRDMVTIKEETKFLTFMSAVAARTGQELNYDNLAKDARNRQ